MKKYHKESRRTGISFLQKIEESLNGMVTSCLLKHVTAGKHKRSGGKTRKET